MIDVEGTMMSADEACLAGIRFYRSGRAVEAEELFGRILAFDPCHARALNAMAVIASDRGDTDHALSCLNMLLTRQPSFAKGYNTRGNILFKLGKTAEAERDFRKAISLDDTFVEAVGNLGDLCTKQKRWEEAETMYQRILSLRPGSAPAYCGLGTAFHGMGNYPRAAECYRAAAECAANPGEPADGTVGSALLFFGAVDAAISTLRKVITANPRDSIAHSTLLLAMHYSDHLTPDDILRESVRWDQLHAVTTPVCHDSAPHPRIRVGYLSSDFYQHVVTYFFEPLLDAHDREQFEIYCYSDVAKPDEATNRLKRMADNWIDCVAMTDRELAEKISRDGIDILVDLKGHLVHNRMRLFTYRPAPVQASWLGYPGTTGVRAIDYRITDGVADPEGMTERFHSETLIRVENCFLCYRPRKVAPPVLSLPALDRGMVTFGSFNDPVKITPAVVRTWGRILNAVPGSHLHLKSKWFHDDVTRERVLGPLRDEGVVESRVSLLDFTQTDWQHLSLYNDVDIALDTFPYNGFATTFDSLWMGVPVVTLAGAIHIGRVGASFLASLGLDELVADTPDDFVSIAVRLASDLERLQDLRLNLRQRMMASPLCDASAFARNMEGAYRRMLDQHLR